MGNRKLLYTVDELRKMLTPIFNSAPVYRAILFGSYAKGTQTEKSDIDIIIDSHGELLNIDFYGVLEDMKKLLGKQIDLFEITEIKNNAEIKSAIDTDGIVLYER